MGSTSRVVFVSILAGIGAPVDIVGEKVVLVHDSARARCKFIAFAVGSFAAVAAWWVLGRRATA